ncbi:1-deoxy-D-xylulose 5-phosphate reductoisomerase [Rubellimicrobium thermophilum DSM 16684]|uniref:1-deoxy-D-xylulose 5-phosphate reductoisomerase n=1 Tax=Rubellimicrobium thermophilum DSM 16684 TaxID=1123069 RepID=S9S7G0_9RHOB|nr:1-deoxy-D-xylulose-5-phosphate reductoisomerase [Rubellimicrobium thermophilum]EPX86090.1 1-deoxy-D-xylulose 5-phosphate reductoisomerase [Rubellimicrobium thermophilum DSM 16684]
MRTVTILGSTGSIGQATLDLISRREGDFAVEALTGAGNIPLLAAQAIRHRARLAVTAREDLHADLKAALAGTGIETAAGPAAVAEAAARPVDWTMAAIVGAAGLVPSLAVLRRGGTLALANKETLVAGGPLVMAEAARTGACLLPVDSEHSGLFQALRGERAEEVERLILTASGGAFRDWPLHRLREATPEQASTHPNWAMGQRITIDSASMFNKALEIIEAHVLFGLPADRIEVVIHPESLVHALVGFRDGALIAHLGAPDMRHAIGFALNHPLREALPVERLDLVRAGRLTFREPDPARYPALRLARLAMEQGGLMPAVFNAAKEAALDAFLARAIRFTQMAEIVERTLDRLSGDGRMPRLCRAGEMPGLDDILEADRLGRKEAAALAGRMTREEA